MQFALQVCGYAIGLPLELLVISALLHGPYKRFPILFAYTIVSFLTTVVEIPAYVAHYVRIPPGVAYYLGAGLAQRSRASFYWFDEGVLMVLLFLVVVTLIWHATAQIRSRRLVRLALIVVPILAASVSFLIHYNPNAPGPGQWMTPWTRDVNFGSAVLDLGLWTLLIASREKDRCLLLLSGALGIQFTGEAIGGSIRYLAVANQGPSGHSGSLVLVGNVFMMAADLVCMYIWWQAFREARVGPPA